MNTATTVTPYASPFSAPYTSVDEGLAHYRPSLWDSRATFLSHLGTPLTDSAAKKVWHEAQWLDVLFDAHRMNRDFDHERAFSTSIDLAPVELSAHERDVAAAQRQAEALGASFAQREKLRAIVTERRDAQRALVDAQTTITQLQERIEQLRFEQITDGNDERLIDFWERAAQKASDENYCGEYDRMAELLGGPGRERSYVVTTLVTIEVSVNVTARTEDDAVSIVDDYDHNDMERHIGDLSYYQINVTEIDARHANADD